MEQNNFRVSDLDLSRFLMNATDFSPKTNLHLMVALRTQLNHVFCRYKYAYPNPLYILSGSVAELNIRTPLPCFSDIDIMLRSNCDIVIPSGADLPKPECLRTMSSRVKLYEAEPTLFPGYLLLNLRGIFILDPENEDRYILHQELFQSDGPVVLPREFEPLLVL